MNMHAFCFPIREVARGWSASSNAVPQRGCSQRQYRLVLLVHPALKFAERHVSWPRFFSSIHFTSEEKLKWPKYTGPWLVFCCSQLRRQRKSTIPKAPSGELLWSELSPLKWTPI